MSLINSLIEQAKSDAEKAELYIRRYNILQNMGNFGVEGTKAYQDETLAKITQYDKNNLEYRLKHINCLFDTKTTWFALTEFMRFEAEALGTCMSEEEKK